MRKIKARIILVSRKISAFHFKSDELCDIFLWPVFSLRELVSCQFYGSSMV
jgi:hypothetical protein